MTIFHIYCTFDLLCPWRDNDNTFSTCLWQSYQQAFSQGQAEHNLWSWGSLNRVYQVPKGPALDRRLLKWEILECVQDIQINQPGFHILPRLFPRFTCSEVPRHRFFHPLVQRPVRNANDIDRSHVDLLLHPRSLQPWELCKGPMPGPCSACRAETQHYARWTLGL